MRKILLFSATALMFIVSANAFSAEKADVKSAAIKKPAPVVQPENETTEMFANNSDMIYLHTQKDKNGKMIIEGYKNGKKLSEADAKKLYDQMQAQQKKQWQAMQQFNKDMDQQMLDEQRLMNTMMTSPVVMMPEIVVVEPSAKPTDTAPAKNNTPQKK